MKKMLALLLALMMFMPVLSMAEELGDLGDLGETGSVIGGADGPTDVFVTTAVTDTTNFMDAALAAGRRIDTVLTISALNGVQTGDPAIDNAVADLLDALALRFSSQGDEGDFALMLSGKDVVNFGGAISGDDCYINSNLLGGTIVVNVNEVEPLLGRLIDMFVLMGALTERDAAEIKTVLAELMASLEQGLPAGMEMPALEEINLSALEGVFIQLLGKITEVENPVVPRMCDPAVAGVQLTVNDAEMKQLVKAMFQFLLDNPVLLNYLSATAGLSADVVKEAMAEVDAQTMLDGEMVVTINVGEDDNIVYATFSLPHHEDGVTTQIDAAYTRQTVAAGVSHVVNITIDGRTVTFDGLASDGKFVGNLYAVDGAKALDVTILTAEEDTLQVILNAYNDEDTVLSVKFEGECEFTDVREYFAGVLNITAYENGQAIPMTFRIVSDYAIDGVDFSGVGGFSFEVMGIEVGLQVASQTSEPQESIMSGAVTRPAELNDAAFQQWFIDIINGLMVQLTNAMTALPESVMSLLIMSGM